MPLYTFICPTCEHKQEVLCRRDERESLLVPCEAEGCGGDTYAAGRPELPTLDLSGNASGRFQMHAITSKGQKIPGHFGKTAKIEPKK